MCYDYILELNSNTINTAHIPGYVFNVTNPVEVVNGKKPVLQEVGPFVYKVITVKNSMSNVFNNDGKTLTYRPRSIKCYQDEKI